MTAAADNPAPAELVQVVCGPPAAIAEQIACAARAWAAGADSSPTAGFVALGISPVANRWPYTARKRIVQATSLAGSDRPALQDALAPVLHQWREAVGAGRAMTAREVVAKADEPVFGGGGFAHPEFREALLAAVGDAKGLGARRLGQWLGYAKGRAVDGLKLDCAGATGGVARWRVVAAPE